MPTPATRGYTMRAKIWGEEKDEIDPALAGYNEPIRIEPTKSYVYNSRGTILSRKEAYCIATRAAAFAKAGDFDGAIKLQIRANAMYHEPEDKRLGEERIKLYRDKKHYHEPRPYRESP